MTGDILYVTEFAGYVGGIEQYARTTAGLLRADGARVSLLYALRAKGFERFITGFDEVYDAPPDRDFSLVVIHKIRDAGLLERLAARYGKRLALIVHDHEPYCPRKYYYTPFGRKNCSRCYSFARCSLCGMAVSPTQFGNGLISGFRERVLNFPRLFALMKKIPSIIVLSKFMRENLVKNGFPEKNITIMAPPVAMLRTNSAPAQKLGMPRIFFAGQLIKGKGADYFIEMLAKLKEPCKAIIIGDGNEKRNLEARARSLGVSVKFAGFVENVSNVYIKADIAVLPFRWQEPFGLVGAEAASLGIPIAAFDVGGVGEWLENGVNGIAVPQGDVDALAEAVDSLLASEEKRYFMGRAGYELALRKFSPSAFIAEFVRFAERVNSK